MFSYDNAQPQDRSQADACLRNKNLAPRFAVINGDDFGFSAGVNAATIEAYKNGILTSTSLMVTAAAFDQAVQLARENPGLAVGLHLVVVCGKSALPPARVPHLVDDHGRFPHGPVLTGLRYQFSRAARRELREEIRAQLEKFAQTGLPLSHVDGHLHMHMHPVVFDILVEMSRYFPIRHIRAPKEETSISLRIDGSNRIAKMVTGWIFGKLHHSGAAKLKRAGIDFSDRVYGLMASGGMTESYVLKLIPQMTGRRVEIYLHPAKECPGESLNGPKGSGPAELETLLSPKVRAALVASGFQLATFDHARAGSQREVAGSS